MRLWQGGALRVPPGGASSGERLTLRSAVAQHHPPWAMAVESRVESCLHQVLNQGAPGVPIGHIGRPRDSWPRQVPRRERGGCLGDYVERPWLTLCPGWAIASRPNRCGRRQQAEKWRLRGAEALTLRAVRGGAGVSRGAATWACAPRLPARRRAAPHAQHQGLPLPEAAARRRWREAARARERHRRGLAGALGVPAVRPPAAPAAGRPAPELP